MMVPLVAAYDFAGLGSTAWGVAQAALGLGFVIFVHELGHFAVAKLCGVKCEKFFIGFDIGGYKLSRKWGETEYGIGILPLGGYVKMLGQDDNPANYAEQMRESQLQADPANSKEIIGPDGQKYFVDRRSYMAKSVPQRMAIISAGVVMNVIFAFIFAVIAFGVGVPYEPSVVSQTAPGSPAWRAGIMPGDEIVEIGGIEDPSYDELKGAVTLANLEHGVPLKVRRGDKTFEEKLIPETGAAGGLVRIGVGWPRSIKLASQMPVRPGSAAAEAEPKFEGGDEIVAVNGKPISTFAEFSAFQVQHAGEPLKVLVKRAGKLAADKSPTDKSRAADAKAAAKEVEITLPPQPALDFGLVLEMGDVVAVQAGSPADQRGIKAGDFIEQISEVGGSSEAESPLAHPDPLALPEILRQLADAGRDVKLTVRAEGRGSEGREPNRTETIPLRPVDWHEEPIGRDDPLSAPALGIAYRVLNRIASVAPGSPADKAGLRSGDMLVSAALVAPPGDQDAKEINSVNFDFSDKTRHSWAGLAALVQQLPAGTAIKLTVQRGDEEETVDLEPTESTANFQADRGLAFLPIQRTRIAGSFSEQLERGWNETVRSLGLVYRFLQKIGNGQVPLTALGGPVTIAKAAGYSAFDGFGKLLTFLTMLSANLAVINFLPIPILDGGHMVFLAYEGLRGRPASERFVVALHALGFAFIVSLMAFVLALDLGWIPRQL